MHTDQRMIDTPDVIMTWTDQGTDRRHLMAVERILPDGHVALPHDVQKAAGLAPGDSVTFRVTGEGTVEIRALPRLTLEEALQRYRIEEDITEDLARSGWQDDAVQDIFGTSDE